MRKKKSLSCKAIRLDQASSERKRSNNSEETPETFSSDKFSGEKKAREKSHTRNLVTNEMEGMAGQRKTTKKTRV